MKVVFLGGLPRSGSTLLSNVLAQNPRFEVTPTSPLCEYVDAMCRTFSASEQRKAYLNQDHAAKMFRGSVRGAIGGYFSAPVGIDKSRGWTGKADLLTKVYGTDLKIIVPIRDLRGCVVSEENKYRKNPEFGWDTNMSDIESRTKHFLNSPPLGPAAVQIKEGLRTHQAESWLFVRMEDFCRNPEDQLDRIYGYIEEDNFIHDLENINTEPMEHDGVHAPIGDHTLTASKIKPVHENWDAVLGHDLAQSIVSGNEWFYRAFYPERL